MRTSLEAARTGDSASQQPERTSWLWERATSVADNSCANRWPLSDRPSWVSDRDTADPLAIRQRVQAN